MSDSERLPRLYDEKEVGKLLDRATQIQREEPVRAAVSGGLSLEELQAIAAEAGIDARYLRRAAMELESGEMEPSFTTRFIGSPATLVVQASVAGEVPADALERLIPIIEEASGVAGQPSQVGRTLTWHATIGRDRRDRSLTVTVSTRDGETHIRAEENLGPVARRVFGGGGSFGIVLGLGLGLNVLGSVLATVAFPIGFAGLSYMAAREIHQRFSSRRRKVLVQIVDQLVREIGEAIATTSPDEGDTRGPLGRIGETSG